MNNRNFYMQSNPEGFLIPFEDGLPLASFQHTEDEARRWIANIKNYVSIDLPIILFGVGAGVHIQLVLEQCKSKIIVVDTRAGLISWARRIFKNTNIEFIHITEEESVLEHPRLSAEIGYAIPLIFEPGSGQSKDYFKAQAAHIIGRTDEVWKARDLDLSQERHWRYWQAGETVEQKILKEILA